MKSIKGNVVDVVAKRIFTGEIFYKNNKIINIIEIPFQELPYILPGFIDAHIHIESSMLVPIQFARLAVKHGTTAVVADPHEIANVLGVEGVDYMIENASKTPFKFFFGAPSCVPATNFETSGANFTSKDVSNLLKRKEIVCLSEMMNFPGVINGDKEVEKMLNASVFYNKPTDGHAPSLTGKALQAYAAAGITTDHESSTLAEGEEKINLGIKLLIREGSAARNFEALYPLIDKYPNEVMFCSDDRHPDDLAVEHISSFVKRALDKKCDLFNVLRAATYNPVKHYNLSSGLLQAGDAADFIVIDNFDNFKILKTIISGENVYQNDEVLIKNIPSKAVNNFEKEPIILSDIQLEAKTEKVKVIKVIDGELLTSQLISKVVQKNGLAISSVVNDILKIVVINRYEKNAKPVIGFINGFGLQKGALCGSIAHDSHNIIAIGVNDSDILKAINSVISTKGGISFCENNLLETLPLPVAGLMSGEDGNFVAKQYSKINLLPAKYGCKLQSPFMTLSFMALLVIPELKLSDKGLFDGNTFQFTDLFV